MNRRSSLTLKTTRMVVPVRTTARGSDGRVKALRAIRIRGEYRSLVRLVQREFPSPACGGGSGWWLSCDGVPSPSRGPSVAKSLPAGLLVAGYSVLFLV